MTHVLVKHGGSKHHIELEGVKCVEDFKQKIQRLTSLPTGRQTLIASGKKIKNEDDISLIKNSKMVLLIGSKTTIKEPKVRYVNEELSTDIVQDLPVGLINMGNSCYLNAVVQVLRNVPEIKHKLITYSEEDENIKSGNLLLVEFGKLLKELDGSNEPVKPTKFFLYFVQSFLKLNSLDKTEALKQQDAEECFGHLFNLIKAETKIGDVFNGVCKTFTKCIENDAEKVVESESEFLMIKCHIGYDTDDLIKGIKNEFSQIVQKKGELSQENLNWKKETQFSSLPEYLIVHFVRFYWKKDIQRKAKIMKKVTFPVEYDLDVFELCTNELKTKIQDNENETSRYKLKGLITHQGPFADEGHYAAWLKNPTHNGEHSNDKSLDWILFDDSRVSKISVEEIKRLHGGGEWHVAYIAVFKKNK